jgi:hypothetical protein
VIAHKIRVEVTAEDIGQGRPFCGDGCPIFLAVHRACSAIPGHPRPRMVSYWRVDFTNDGAAGLPVKATDFIVSFDAGRPVAPFAFELEG